MEITNKLNKPPSTRPNTGGSRQRQAPASGVRIPGLPSWLSIGVPTSYSFNVNFSRLKTNRTVNTQLNQEIANFRKAGFEVKNEKAFKNFRRAEIASGRKPKYYTPAEAKAAANEALRKSVAGAFLGAGLAVAAPLGVLAASAAAAGGGAAALGGATGQGQRIAAQQGVKIATKLRKLQRVKNLLTKAQTQTISFGNMTQAVNAVAGPFKNRVAAALGGHVQAIPELIREMTVASSMI